MKKTLFLLSALLCLTIMTPTLSNAEKIVEINKENFNEELFIKTSEKVYEDENVIIWNHGDNEEITRFILQNSIELQNSVVGPDGRASLEYLPGIPGLHWTATPYTSWPYVFTGYVDVEYYTGEFYSYPVGGVGALGSTVSGSITLKQNGAGEAEFSGRAYSPEQMYVVLPGVTSYFYKFN